MTRNPSSDSLRPGARLTANGATFVLRAPRARAVDLLRFRKAGSERPEADHSLARAPGSDLWHVSLPGITEGQLYAYRVWDDASGGGEWVLDPCARAVTWAGRTWGDRTDAPRGVFPRRGAHFPKAALVDDDAFDWGDDVRPTVPRSDRIVYELHVRGFTRGAGAGVTVPGTYEGLIERIPYIRDLGVTTVELMPVHEFNELEFWMEGGARRDLLNVWGYSPLAFSAPMARYAATPAEPTASVYAFKKLVKALHGAGLEVMLDVVFNHTGEGSETGPAVHYKRLAPDAYYLHKDDGTFRDVTGCGNTLNANHPAGIETIVDSLCVWAEAMHVDGFRFDLAGALTRGPDGEVLENPPLLERIAAEPRLRHCTCIAEPWDAVGHHPGGRFPAPDWAVWNDRFRDDVRRFWAGHPDSLGPFATRLAGSSDMFESAGRTPLHSLNYVACHDGFPLGDLVRYAKKHNRANRERNRDGMDVNFSLNYGIEGETDDPEIRARREQHIKNLMATLFLSQGIPMLTAGDEFGRTQQGNNNAYAQDNELSWLDWTQLEPHRDLHAFTRTLIAFRKAHRSLRRDSFFPAAPGPGQPDAIVWFGLDGNPPDWSGGVALACRVDGRAECTGADHDEPSLFLAFNGGKEPASFHVPEPAEGWRLAWATQDPLPNWTGAEERLTIDAGSVAALETR